MRLLLLRHGEAGFDAPNDLLRPLTANGRHRLTAMFDAQVDLLRTVERIIHSPYLRTTQTAELACAVCGCGMEASEQLVPEASPGQVIDWLQGICANQSDTDTLLLVTHQPLVGNLVSLLCEGDQSRPEPMLPGAMAVIDLDLPAAGLGVLSALTG